MKMKRSEKGKFFDSKSLRVLSASVELNLSQNDIRREVNVKCLLSFNACANAKPFSFIR